MLKIEAPNLRRLNSWVGRTYAPEAPLVTDVNEVGKITLIYYKADVFLVINDEREGHTDTLFYIPKYKDVYTWDQLVGFIHSHPKERFAFVGEGYRVSNPVFTFVETKPNKIKLTFFVDFGEGRLTRIGMARNKDKSTEPIAYDFDKGVTVSMAERPGDPLAFSTVKGYPHRTDFRTIPMNTAVTTDLADTAQIINHNLKITGTTRVICVVAYSELMYTVSPLPRSCESATKRLGIDTTRNADDGKYWSHHTRSKCIHTDETFNAPMDPETFERIKTQMLADLRMMEEERKKKPKEVSESQSYYRSKEEPFIKKSYLVIDKSLEHHFRPTFHLILGIALNGEYDVQEVLRGDLQMKDMIPTTTYYLSSTTGNFVHVSHELYTYAKNMVMNATIDPVSFNEWAGTKSLNPALVMAVARFGRLELETIGYYNRLKFGTLFVEQLIKSGLAGYGESFAEYINEKADRIEEHCNSLSDILPGVNAMETSLQRILGLSKPTMQLLLDKLRAKDGETRRSRRDVEDFQDIYNMVKEVFPDNIVNKERLSLFDKYQYLVNNGHWYTGVRFDDDVVVHLLDHKAELLSMAKMYHRIDERFAGDSEWHRRSQATRHYDEIVKAYFMLLSYGFNPGDQMVFLEFSLGGTSVENLAEIGSREHAANRALASLRGLIDAEMRARREKSYAFRRDKALSRLEIIPKDTEKKPYLGKYTVIAPSAIYGLTPGTIELEGDEQSHCVFRNYAADVAEGKYTIMFLRKAESPDKSLITIGITSEGRINQTYGFSNRSLHKEEAQAIAKWASKFPGKLTFSIEGRDVQPGGWHSEVELPKLPPVDDAWIDKLAATE